MTKRAKPSTAASSLPARMLACRSLSSFVKRKKNADELMREQADAGPHLGRGGVGRSDAEGIAEQRTRNREGGVGKRKGRRWPIVVGVIAAVVVAAGAGFWVWHEQPSFCNAVCHDPMDAYVDGYFSDATLMANAHERADVTCLKCHEAKLSDQVAEVVGARRFRH